MTARPRWLAGLLAVLSVAAVAGCGIPADPGPHAVTPPPPYGRTTTEPVEVTAGALTKTLYLTRDGKVARVDRPAEEPPTAREVLGDLVEPITPDEQELGYGSALAGTTVIEDVGIANGIATVAIGDGLEGLSSANRGLAYAQIVCTLDELPGVDGVLFTRNGEQVPVPDGDGTPTSDPLTRADYETVLEPA